MGVESGQITELLAACRGGDKEAEARLITLVYDELHRMARRYMGRERKDHTLQPTALVHEAYLRLLKDPERNWQNRAQFFGFAAQVMRHILVDYARAQRSDKRGGRLEKLNIDEAALFSPERARDVLLLDEALNRLQEWDPRQSRIVELKFFVGLTEEEIAELLGISVRTVKRDWSMARAWLYGELDSAGGAT